MTKHDIVELLDGSFQVELKLPDFIVSQVVSRLFAGKSANPLRYSV